MANLIDEPGFREEFARALVQSQRHRAIAFASVLASLAVIVLILSLRGDLAPALYAPAYGLVVHRWAILLIGFTVVYELFVWRVLRGRRVVPKPFPYLTTVVEMMLPAGLLLIFAQAMDVTHAVSAPPVMVFSLLIVLAALHVDAAVCVFAGVVAAVYYLVLYRLLVVPYHGPADGTFLTEPAPHFIRAVLLVLIGVGAAFVTWHIKRRLLGSFEVQAEKNRVLALLGEQVSPEVAQTLLREGGAGRVQRVCVMFLDIRGFTSLAETKSPEQTVDFLNTLFEPMIRAVNAHHGVINKFLGDGFMAVFGPPFTEGDPSTAAVAAATEILDGQQGRDSQGTEPIGIGIGLHTGEAVTGNIGSELRKEYTVIGDVVNLASRIEQLTKPYSAQLLVSSAVYENLDPAPEPLETIDRIQVKGREEPITVYRLA